MQLGVLGDFLQSGRTSDGRFVVETNSTDITGPDVLLLFSDPTNTRILCLESSQTRYEPVRTTTSEEGLMIRGRVSELALSRDELNVRGASAAEVSLRNDRRTM